MALSPINNNFTVREIVNQIDAAGTKWVVTDEIGWLVGWLVFGWLAVWLVGLQAVWLVVHLYFT